MIRNTSPAPDKQTDSPKQKDKICSQHNNPTYTTSYLQLPPTYIHTSYISADGPVSCCVVLCTYLTYICIPNLKATLSTLFSLLPFSVFCLFTFEIFLYFLLFYLFFVYISMILGGADVSFLFFCFWGQPDSGLICLVSFEFE